MTYSLSRSKRARAAISRAVEPLESRLYRDSTPWAFNATLIHQDQAVSDFPWITGAGQTVVIMDTGAVLTNASLAGKTITAWQDYVGTKSTPVDTVGHGTGVTGIIAGNHFDYNGFQDQGVAPGVNVILLRTDTEKNSTSWATQAGRISSALDWVIAHQAQYNIVAVNMSTGDSTGFTDPSTPGDPDNSIDQVLRGKFATLAGEGVFLAAAAGNDGNGTLSSTVQPNTVNYPAADPNVYAISSVNSSGQVSAYASRGALTDLLAAGENIYMPYGDIAGSDYVPDGNAQGTGTSFSAPAVTAAAALLRQISPDFTPAQIMSILQQSGTPVTDSTTGNTFDLLNLDAAIKLAYADADDLDNHSLATATNLSFSNDSAGLSNLTSLLQTHDYYKFTVGSAADVTFSLSTTDGESLAYSLLNASGNSVATLTGGKTVNVAAGTYYVRVDGNSTTLNGTYALSLSKTDSDDLNNHSFATATPINVSSGSGQLTNLTLVAGASDFYSFVLSANSNVTLSVSSDGVYPTTNLADANGNVLAAIPSGGLTTTLNAGTYYVGVTSPSAMTYGVAVTQSAIVAPPVNTPGANATVARTAYDSSGNLRLAYYDGTTRTLKYAVRDSGGTWSAVTTVDSAVGAGTQLSIAVDPSGNTGIAYYASGTGDLKYAHLVGSTWTVSTPDYYKTTGLTPSLTYNSAGQPLIAYYDSYYGQLRLANQVGSAWSIYVVDASGNTGLNASIAYDAGSNAYGIGYEDVKSGALKYATYYRGFRASVIDATTRGGVSGISLAISPTTHNPAVSYFDVANADLVYAAYNGRWSVTHVATARSQGQFSNLTFNSSGTPDVLYYTATYAAINRAAPTGSVWSLTRIASGGIGLAEATDASGDDTISWIAGSGVSFLDL